MKNKLFFILILFTISLTYSYELTISEEMNEIVEVYKIIETTNDDFLYELYHEDLEKMLCSLYNRLYISLKIGNRKIILDFVEKYEKIDKEYKFLFKNYLIVLNNLYVRGE